MKCKTFVICPMCGYIHLTCDIDALDIVKTVRGDRVTYVCPVAIKEAKAFLKVDIEPERKHNTYLVALER